MLIKSLSELRSLGGLPLYCVILVLEAEHMFCCPMLNINAGVGLCNKMWVCATRLRQWWCNTMLFRNVLPSAPWLSMNMLWIDNSECAWWLKNFVFCACCTDLQRELVLLNLFATDQTSVRFVAFTWIHVYWTDCLRCGTGLVVHILIPYWLTAPEGKPH